MNQATFAGVLVIGLVLPVLTGAETLAIDLAKTEADRPFVAAAFSLDLDRLDLDQAGAFRLFPASDVPLRPTVSVDLEPALGLSLAYAMDDKRIPEGLQMSFKERTWKDYDGWEKAGYILSEASAAVGAAYLLYALID